MTYKGYEIYEVDSHEAHPAPATNFIVVRDSETIASGHELEGVKKYIDALELGLPV